MKLSDWLCDWLENYVKPANKTRTYKRYCEISRLHIAPYIGDLDMDDLTLSVLQRMVATLLKSGNLRTKQPLSSNSVNCVISVLQNALRSAHQAGLTQHFIADKIRRPRTVEKRIQCMSLKEQLLIEKFCLFNRKTKFLGFVICLYTGLRVGEILALRWDDVDLKACTLSVNKTCYDTKDGLCLCEPKTLSSKRTIPFPKQLKSVFKQLQKHCCDCQHVISHNGRPVGVRSYQRSFELILKNLGIPHRGVHSLRHTFATRAIECGMDIKTLSEILGHKNAAITLNRYAHSLMQHKIEMMNRLGRLL